MMVSAEIMCKDALDCLGWPYVSPGSNDSKGIDCSGLFVYLFKKQGAHIYHGSNTIWREYTTADKGPLQNSNQLKPGMAVFKNRDWKESDSSNRWYKKDKWGNMYHIGLVRSVKPLVIEHATSVGKKCVVEQYNLKGWTHYAALKNVNYGSTEPDEDVYKDMTEMVVTCVTGNIVKMRSKPSTSAEVVMRIPKGTVVEAGEQDGLWRPIEYDGKKGYMMAEFLIPYEDGEPADGNPPKADMVVLEIPYQLAYELRDILIKSIGMG